MGTSGREVKLTHHLNLVPMSMHGAIRPLPQYSFMAWCSLYIKTHRDNFTFSPFTVIESGIPMELDRPIKMCLNETYSKVRICKNLSATFLIIIMF